ncbi:MAG: M20 family metallopeptidase [Armatimonadota bacterium]|nr:M20 family metallopeptidase [Armatimonadota bacterium]MDR7421594.1 M20 family metallopeptidase [Armatimonadota bacterium]MDR7455460.1 M20 family metallopeptidase [Armatimonadota bacterium]MDR7511279.1 M20 family metallopeptidase [Armatimonadota bacterium]
MTTDSDARLPELTARRLPEATALLETLVNLDTCSRAPAALAAAADWLEAQLRDLGLEVERRDAPSGPTLIGRAAGRGGRRLLLLGHYDTVFEPGEPQRRPFRTHGDRAYGPGVADMKGGLVVLWEALRALRAIGWDDYGALTVIHNHDEEVGSLSSRPHIEAAAREADVCLVLEPGRPDGSIVAARKGVARFVLAVHGKAAHAGVAPQDGASAVVALAHKIVALHALNDHAGGVSVNAIVTRGGTRANVVPDLAEAEIDVRVPTPAAGEAVAARIGAIAAVQDLPGTRAELAGGAERPPFERTAAVEALVALARGEAARLGVELRATATGGGSDGNFVAALGVPVLDGLGAVGGAYHSPEEYLLLHTVPERAALLALLLRRLGRR